jgi:glucose-6-phosphate 1-dehydrogenase
MDHEEYLKRVKSYIKTPTKDMEQQLADFCAVCTYVSGQYDKDESFVELRKHLEELEKGRKESNRVFYMALPPSVFTTVSQHLKKNCYPKSGIARIIVSFRNNMYLVAMLMKFYRSRSHSERILPAPANCRRLWSQTGMRRRFSVLTITLERRWSRTF